MRKITYQSILLNEKEGDTLTQQLRSLVEASYKHRINKTQNFRLNVAGYVVYPLEDDEKALQPITIQVDQSSGKASDGPETHPDQTCLNKILMQLIKNNIFSQETREINGETLKLTDPREYADKFKKLIKGEICNDGKKYSILFFSERAPCKIHNPRYNGRSPVCDKYIKDVLGEDFLEYIYYLVPHRENAQVGRGYSATPLLLASR